MMKEKTDAYAALEQRVYAALETYSNVHRGSGLFSRTSTHLYEQARDRVLEYLQPGKSGYTVIFCSTRRASRLASQLKTGEYTLVSARDIGLSLGISALAVKRNALPKGAPQESGGGTTRLVSPDWIIWGKAPDRFEAGTPPVINVIAFACALQLVKKFGKDIFVQPAPARLSARQILQEDELQGLSGMELLQKLRGMLIGSGIQVPTLKGQRTFINLDNAASTPSFTPIWNAFRLALNQPQEVQQEIIREVKSICSQLLGASPSDYDIIFTSNTTEAINLAAESLDREKEQTIEPVIVTSLLEHSANDLPWRRITSAPLIRLSINEEGFINPEELETILREYNQEHRYGSKRVKLVALSGASNALGIYNNPGTISRIAHKYGVRLLVDAAQMVAHRRVEMENWGVDYLAFSAHKIYAPFGTGVLIVRKGLLKFNGPEIDLINSSGEENPGGIAALGKALLLLQRIGMERIQEEEQALTAKLLRGMAEVDGIRLYGVRSPDSPGFINRGGVVVFTMKAAMSNVLARELALRGIGIRYGCHCAHILIKHILGVGPKLEKFQKMMLTLLPSVQLPGVARVSLGIQNTEKEVDELLNALLEIARKKNSAGETEQMGNHVLSKNEVQQQMRNFISLVEGKIYQAE
jgi:selenocysteine lyase/cysteine desulfurase